ncbi:AEL267Cp [Eremothecium gossypii ATCC 10895]|uniref:DNA polymerase epsilon subunit B n=1 Tax=Eremothecium gossypii (strain ATCC 10895 / CBS 109.51 / FGSC 9923 / NRRL Y-1056) TaxID=284811 RepID=DPB2_EREGS|nr:AEL267Cp [Eremothecium gossypii ATCC 10895]Q758V1.1 RecName: Full=DNA polymerase epsilon subunit B; AltName: Full=DNA polymerase II subunit 2 [Eremothecium gossypii ATCC 10895]AAS52417.1 AEL267Cp [Eremothecium gossypii ATCC 10895]AEY96715.1 FAEL267Cp [Eremothecium gossypii FDAG1]
MDRGSALPAEISPQLLRPLAYRVLSKKYGLHIKSDGLAQLAKFIGNAFGVDWRRSAETMQFLERFAAIWREQERGLFVDALGVDAVTQELRERNKTAKQRRPARARETTLDALVRPTEAYSAVESSGGDVTATEPMDEDTVREEPLDWTHYFKVIDTFSQQQFTYDVTKRRYRLVQQRESAAGPLSTLLRIPSLEANLAQFPTRYHLVRDRVLRNASFQNDDVYNPLSSMQQLQQQLDAGGAPLASTAYMSITQIKNLLGRDGKNFLLLGLIRKDSKGFWSLEDPSGSIEIDISETYPTKGTYYVPGCIVLAEGIYSSAGNRFRVSSITHPPGERREAFLEAIGNLDLLGIHGPSNESYISRLDKELKIRLHYLEKELTDHRFVFLGGNIFLDDTMTETALAKLFDVLEHDPPTVLVLPGSFTSTPIYPSSDSKSSSSTAAYRANFDALAKLLSKYERLINETTFVFIPGDNDPWGSMAYLGVAGTLPQHPIPGDFVTKVNRICKHVVWGSNPTRIAYLSQELVIMRDDMCNRFKRNSIIFPTVEEEQKQEYMLLQQELQDDERSSDLSISQLIKSRDQLPASVQESRKIVKTILDQQHLSPFTSQVRPITWDYDYTLHLSPIPSTMIICDPTAPKYDVTYNGCKSINPGSFLHKRSVNYTEYTPSLRKATEEEIVV